MGHFYTITPEDFNKALRSLLDEWTFYAPLEKNDLLRYELVTKDNIPFLVLDTLRPIQPLKSFLYLFQEQVTNIRKFPNLRNTAVIGVKSCDLAGLSLFDKIMIEGDAEEPFYKRRRQDLLIISSDCQQPADTCFCALMDINPYSEEGFDLNLSTAAGAIAAEAGSEKGEEFIRLNKDLFHRVTGRDVQAKRQAKRRAVIEKVNEINERFDFKGPFLAMLRQKHSSEVWKNSSKTCVTCGACTQICPFCYCFILEDSANADVFEKTRIWDSCQYTGFARVAGGANPRRKVEERLRHRYLHKLDFIREAYGFDGCSGCGRCIAACPGKIDMRKVLTDLNTPGIK